MTMTYTAPAAPIDVAELAQLLVCEAAESRPGAPVVITFSDITTVLCSIEPRMPVELEQRVKLLQDAVGLATRCAVRSWA